MLGRGGILLCPRGFPAVTVRLKLRDGAAKSPCTCGLDSEIYRERQIFLARTLEEEDFETLGAKFGLSYKGVAALYYRTIQKIRKSIEGGDKR